MVGCTAAGVITPREEIDEGPGLSVLGVAGAIDVRPFLIPSLRGRSFDVGREIGSLAAGVAEKPRTILLLADSYNLAPDELLAGVGLQSPDTHVLGAGASEDGSRGETSVVGRRAEADNAAAGLVLGGVGLESAVVQTCQPVGRVDDG